MNKIEIITDNGVTKVSLNGNKLNGVKKVSFSHEANTAPVAIVEIYVKAAVIDSPVMIDVNNAFTNNN
ncbi:MAG: hypothetical protein E6940_10650 [Clostridium septicum]|uniref:hypothetical protein n=1 Tax=Clostridium septicum TaxID=1504 RepID=UPI002588B9EA|nr:hypothetical protein [Clostridium septicum]MDU1314503.1 hypothetical protein [Clostridium septicum]